jgi:hypothetical protein
MVERHAFFTYDLTDTEVHRATELSTDSLIFVSGDIHAIYVQLKFLVLLSIQWTDLGEYKYWSSGRICRVIPPASLRLIRLVKLSRGETHHHLITAPNVSFDDQTHK